MAIFRHKHTLPALYRLSIQPFLIWFFYLVWKLEFILGASLGLRSLPGFPYIKPQSSGAYLAIAVLAIWSARRHIRLIFRVVFSRSSQEDLGEPMRYQTALGFIVFGVTFLAFFWIKAGMSPWVFIIFFGFYFLLMISLIRVFQLAQ